MSRAASTALLLLLALTAALEALALRARLRGTGFREMPVFVPVSLDYERELRRERGQPPGAGGEEAVALARALSELDPAELPPELRARLEPELRQLAAERQELLELRDRRHQLNVAMMRLAVELARELRPEQWAAVVSHRDAQRAVADREVFDRLLRRWGEAP